MTRWTADQIKEYLRSLEEGAEVSLKELMEKSGLLAKDIARFLTEYYDRPVTITRREDVNHREDNFLFPGKTSYPVYQVGSAKPEEPPEIDISPILKPDTELTAEATRTEIIVPVDTMLSHNELRRMLGKEIGWNEADDVIQWWEVLGHVLIEATPQSLRERYGDTMYRLKALGEGTKEETRIVMHTLPKTVWYVSRKGGLYDYLEQQFGWSRSQATAYFRDKLLGDSDRRGVGYYRVPHQIPIEETMLVTAREAKPLPERFLSILRWQARAGGAGSKSPYTDSYEFDACIRLPRGMNKEYREQALADLMQLVLDDRGYPDLREILASWHDAVWMGTTTTQTSDDGEWSWKYMGNPQRTGKVSVDKVFNDYDVSVWGR